MWIANLSIQRMAPMVSKKETICHPRVIYATQQYTRTLSYSSLKMTSGSCRVFFEAEGGIRDDLVTGVQACALPISRTTFCSNSKLRTMTSRQREFPHPRRHGPQLRIAAKSRARALAPFFSALPCRCAREKRDRKSVV